MLNGSPNFLICMETLRESTPIVQERFGFKVTIIEKLTEQVTNSMWHHWQFLMKLNVKMTILLQGWKLHTPRYTTRNISRRRLMVTLYPSMMLAFAVNLYIYLTSVTYPVTSMFVCRLQTNCIPHIIFPKSGPTLALYQVSEGINNLAQYYLHSGLFHIQFFS